MSEQHIGAALQQFLNKSKLKSGVQSAQIESIWEQVMGKTIAKYTDRIQLINKTLFIYTTVGPLKQEIMYQKNKIVERVNEAMHDNVITNVVVH